MDMVGLKTENFLPIIINKKINFLKIKLEIIPYIKEVADIKF